MELICFNGWGFRNSIFEDFLNKLGFKGKITVLRPDKVMDSDLLSSTSKKIIICWSLGGPKFMAEFDKLYGVVGMVLINSTPSFCRQEAYALGWDMDILEEMYQNLVQDHETVLEAFLRKCVGKNSPLDIETLKRHLLYQEDDQNMITSLKMLTSINVIQNLKDIQIPTLVLAGKRDRVISSKNSSMLEQYLPNARYVPYAQAGHLVFIEEQAEVVKEIDTFIRSLYDQ